MPPGAGAEIERQLAAQPLAPGDREAERPAVGAARQPVESEEAGEQGGAQRAGEVGAALAPVEAGAGEGPAPAAGLLHFDP